MTGIGAVNVLAAIGDHQASVEAAYNLASGKAVRIGEILARLIDLSSSAIDVEIDAEKFRPNDIARTCGDASKAFGQFGWKPEIDFQQTIADVLDDQRRKVNH